MKTFSHKAAAVFAAMLACAASTFAAPNAEDAAPTPAPILTTDLSGSDITFLTAAAPRIALLTQLSALGKKRAVTPEVRAEADLAWKEQTDAAARLKALAARFSVALSEAPESSAKTQLLTLGKLKGLKFDKSYLDAQADALEGLRTILQSAAASANRDIKDYAESTLNTVRQQQQRLHKLGL